MDQSAKDILRAVPARGLSGSKNGHLPLPPLVLMIAFEKMGERECEQIKELRLNLSGS